MITLLIVGGVLVLGGGACVVLGGLIYLGANAEPDPAAEQGATPGKKTGQPGTPSTGTAAPSSPSPPTTAAADENDEDDPTSAATGTPTSGAAPATPPAPPGPNPSGGTKWFCNATGWVRVCGFANVCSNQMVSGIGSGTDRFMASMMAKNACEGMARAKGGSTVCVVSCSVR